MMVYLISERGATTAFKISTGRVFSTFDNVVELVLFEIAIKDKFASHREVSLIDILMESHYTYIIYTAELNSLNKAKRVDFKEWKIFMKDYIKREYSYIEKLEVERMKDNLKLYNRRRRL